MKKKFIEIAIKVNDIVSCYERSGAVAYEITELSYLCEHFVKTNIEPIWTLIVTEIDGNMYKVPAT